MNGFAARYADKGLVVIAIDVKEEEGAVAAFAPGLDVTFPMGLDLDGKASAEWGAVALPVHSGSTPRDRPRRRPRRDRPGHHGRRPEDDPARSRRHALTGRPGTTGRRPLGPRSRGRPGRLLVVSDFDGTLAEGSRDPGAAAIVPLARQSPCAGWPASRRNGPTDWSWRS